MQCNPQPLPLLCLLTILLARHDCFRPLFAVGAIFSIFYGTTAGETSTTVAYGDVSVHLINTKA